MTGVTPKKNIYTTKNGKKTFEHTLFMPFVCNPPSNLFGSVTPEAIVDEVHDIKPRNEADIVVRSIKVVDVDNM